MISVCLATYNGERYLQQQLDSVFPQLRKGDEVLISDDGSTDGSLRILKSIQNPQVILFQNRFQNPVSNFEFLFQKASKEIIVPCDQDDVWLPNKLETIRAELAGKQETCLLMNAEIINSEGGKTGQTTFDRWKTRTGFWANLRRNTFMGSNMAFAADLLKVALPFPKDIPMHDWWIGLLAEKTGSVKTTEEPVMLYRIHGENASLQGSSLAQKIKWRLQMLSAINQRLRNG